MGSEKDSAGLAKAEGISPITYNFDNRRLGRKEVKRGDFGAGVAKAVICKCLIDFRLQAQQTGLKTVL